MSILFFSVPAASAEKILAVQSIRIAPYEQALKGFESICKLNIRRFVLSDYKGVDITHKIKSLRPDMILAIGATALSKVKQTRDIPVVYFMVLDPKSVISSDAKNISGISMNIPQKDQLSIIVKIFPDAKDIGVIYNPEKTGFMIKRAEAAAWDAGINLIKKTINDPKDAASRIMEMQGKIDLFWLFPDTSVLMPETIKFLFLFSMNNKIPVIAFSKNYLGMGALLSIGIDSYDIGRQAGELAKKILKSHKKSLNKHIDVRKPVISLNKKIADKLEIKVNKHNFNAFWDIDEPEFN
ncbi:ABC transporter substrate-binding protein [Desulfosarcina sp. BuS5]|uniref:ABC transporter substrate-binding protein n=1 Tax=Desulfosarcina sp. BuS5 TaxID=933262 RepID=UPI0018DD52B0|nr:ABC transporter substrate binding protein [Desulfosarcina sp. BuS5]